MAKNLLLVKIPIFGGWWGGEVQKRHKEKFLLSALSALVVYMDKPNFLGFLKKTGLLH